MSQLDYYYILQVDKTATTAEIKSAYRKLANLYHPDKSSDANSEEKMRELNEAYSVLSDESRREEYDNSLKNKAKFATQQKQQFEQGFEYTNTAKVKPQYVDPGRVGEDIYASMNVSFAESLSGVVIQKKLTRQEGCKYCEMSGYDLSYKTQCDLCKGQGKLVQQLGGKFSSIVCAQCYGNGYILSKKCQACNGRQYTEISSLVNIRIPSGIHNKGKLKLKGLGKFGRKGNGDYIIVVTVEEHKYFKRYDSNDLLLTMPVSINSILNEEKVVVPTPTGTITIQLKETYTTDTVVVFKKQGVNINGEVGNLRVRLKVVVPEYDKLLKQELKRLLSVAYDPTNKNFVKEVKEAK
ncbi:chaperone protein [Mycoplasmopsis californica]|uniref:DnaJ domain-containing protein n=1 Tax=Mycoplasmopsis equigenitalium TaxID=114883 RepID=A0ABY5J1U3_9BACT|nr:DnaJ C-terminal domain-containing protein [Mycoplasmopsis equigenitalium]UUD37213.1 DnaJ domain-containing protein [Mycoplasmopsis equigenitalium]VEU69483.1 chaperone protein [Mycoplasmopsis californica]